ncbi:MAG: hypothetical protein GQ570_02120 [Helicobacteraceae bacterium]|nr:hypothetical protein [Helicobacteraceae bacterium]
MKKYIFIVVGLFIFISIANEIYTQVNKKDAKSKRVECQEHSTMFEKVVNKELLNTLQKSLKSGSVDVEVTAQKSTYMKSKLFEYVKESDIKDNFLKLVNKNRDTKATAKVDILIYENDKKDPGKKTAKSKLYAGYLVLSFNIQSTLVYKIQIDFMDDKGRDVQRVLECALNSAKTIK